MTKPLIDKRHFNQYVNPEALRVSEASPAPKAHLKPATLAVLVQCAAMLVVFAFSYAMHSVAAVYFGADLTFSIPILVLMQALQAAIFSYLAGMASWWRWIHLSFPIAVWGMFSWQLPNEFYLTGFIVSLSLFWTTFRSQVPFFPSRPLVWRQVARVMPKNRPVRLIDIGSGLGDMPMYIAKVRPDCHIEGIEIAPLPWLVSYVRGQIRRSAAIFKLGDYRSLDFANYDIIFAYLSPAAMLALWEKARQEMKSGSLLISLEFEIPGVTPNMRIAGGEHSPIIYVWRLP
ncbi:MAG: class I SAM-dependent methyltransferase [Methylotenera sp.]